MGVVLYLDYQEVRVIAGKLTSEVFYNSHFYNLFYVQECCRGNCKMGVVVYPDYQEERVIPGKLTFDDFFNSHFMGILWIGVLSWQL